MIGRRAILSGLLATASVPVFAQRFKVGRAPGFQSGLRFFSAGAQAAAFTMTQLATANRIYQRASTTGGGQAKGQGTVPVTINVTTAGAIYARRRSASDGATIVQAAWQVSSNVATGSQTLNITGVDAPAIGSDAATPTQANDGAFFLDLSGDGNSWTNGTTAILMGDLTNAWGQSQVTYMFTRIDAVNISGTISPYGRVFAQYNGYTPGTASLAWELPSNTGNYKGSMAAEYVRCMVSATGVAHGLVGYAIGGTLISAWQSGQPNMNGLLQTMAAAGGSFRFEYGMIGTTDAQIASTSSYFQSALTNAWSAARGGNSYPSPIRTVASIPAVASQTTTGDWTMVNTIRQATKTWAASNSSAYIQPLGTKTYDGTHQTNAAGGGDYMAREVFRSFRSALGLAGTNAGPTVNSISRTGTVITIALSSAPAANSGTPWKRFRVFDTGNLNNPRAIASSAISGSNITLTLAVDPGPGAVLDLYPYTDGYVMLETALDLSGETFFDQNIQSDETALGFTRGRQIDFNTIGVLTVPAQTSGGAVNAIPPYNMTMTSPTYQTGATNFGNELASGSGLTTAAMLVPQPPTFTFEAWLTCPTAPAANSVVISPPDKNLWIGFNSSGQLILNGSTVLSTTNYAGAGRIFVRLTQTPSARKVYVATAQGATPTLINTVTLGTATSAFRVEYAVGAHVRSDGAFSNTTTLPVDSIALFAAENTYAAPSASYVGNETNLLALYNFESNGNDSCTN